MVEEQLVLRGRMGLLLEERGKRCWGSKLTDAHDTETTVGQTLVEDVEDVKMTAM